MRGNEPQKMTKRDRDISRTEAQLFDRKPRNSTDPSRRAETTYAFLDRSSLSEHSRVRCMLERWVDRLPMEQRQNIVAKLRHALPGSAKEEHQFNAAWFELFMHEFLLGTGGQIEVEPRINERTPDFRITERQRDGRHVSYVVEAKDLDLERGTELERDWNERIAIDALDEIPSPSFILLVDTRGRLESSPKKKDIKRPFEELLKAANYDYLLIATESPGFNFKDLPTAQFQHSDWCVTGRLYPVSPDSRQSGSGFVGVLSGPASHINDIGKTKNSLYEKAKRYKNIADLIIALRCDHTNTRLAEALFGSQVAHIYIHDNPVDRSPLPDPYYTQKLDGFWVNSDGPQNRNVIGVVTFYSVYPWSLDSTKAIFYSNPYTERPLPEWANLITHAEYFRGKVKVVEGVAPAYFLKDYEIINNPYT